MADLSMLGLLLEGDHASRPAANTVGAGTLYACSDHSLIYQSDASAWATWADISGSGSSFTVPVVPTAIVHNNASDYSTSSTSLVDVDGTNLSITKTFTGARRARISFAGSVSVSVATGGIGLDVKVDGTDLKGDFGLHASSLPDTGNHPMAFTHITGALTAASHTFVLRYRAIGATNALIRTGTTTYPVLFNVEELAS